MTKFVGFVPCRAGSERVKNKNTRKFSAFSGGLLELKLLQLSKVSRLDEIIVSSNDDIVLEYVEKFSRDVDSRFIALRRPDEWGASSTSMGMFISEYISSLRPGNEVIFWTHVTSPFIASDQYTKILEHYESAVFDGFDSLITVTRLQKFIWRQSGPVNYDNTIEKWPRSQDLEPLFEINHGAYVLPFSVMKSFGDRIGAQPYFYELSEDIARDIDWEDQFVHLEEELDRRLIIGADIL